MNGRVFLAVTAAFFTAYTSAITVRDAFGRDVTKQGIVLLDWDGYMANPAIKLTVEVDPNDNVQALDIRSDCVRMMFDRAGDISGGPLGKSMRIDPGQNKADVWVSIFPDRDGKDEDWTIEFKQRGEKSWTMLKVRVIDQDKLAKPVFNITTNYSQDKTGFLKDKDIRRTINQAAADWTYFIDDMKFDSVPKGDETTTLWTPEGFVNTYTAKNDKPYNGFLLYFVGIKGPDMRSGGAPSYDGKKQTSKGKELPLLRSGAVEVELQGSYTKYGWYVDSSDSNWWACGSQSNEQADLYSILLHEMGHAIAFESNYPFFGQALKRRELKEARVKEYLGNDPAVDQYCHFDHCIDPASGFGAFGAEYQAKMKVRRWLITKTHLLLLQAVGYRIRPISCFEALSFPSTKIELRLGKEFSSISLIKGGLPAYRCSLTNGALPKGVSLGEYDGKLSGAPLEEGLFEIDLRVDDQSPTEATASAKIAIEVVR